MRRGWGSRNPECQIFLNAKDWKLKSIKSASLNPNLQNALVESEKAFLDFMQRPILDHDRLFYWSYCYSELEFKHSMIHTMLVAGIPEELVYVYDKTGFAVGEEGYAQLTKEEKKEIKSAIADYKKIARKKVKLYDISKYDNNHVDQHDPLVSALYIFGNFIERNVNSGNGAITEQNLVVSYLLVRAYRILRALARSQKFSTSEESLILVRSLYEIYCKLVFAIADIQNAQYLLDSDFGLSTGEFEVLKKNGKIKRNLLVNKSSGKIIPRNESFYKCIEASTQSSDKELFEVLYEYLSSFVHSGSRHVLSSWIKDKSGFALTNEDDEQLAAFVALLGSFISALIMQSLLQTNLASKISKWDITLFCFALKKVLADVEAPNNENIAAILSKMKIRSESMPNIVEPFEQE